MGINILVRNMDLVPQGRQDSRRLEVVADGLPLFHGAQLAIDTTLVSPVGRDGLPRPRCVREDGAALTIARRRKERTYPELTGRFGRAKLVVLACEVAAGARQGKSPHRTSPTTSTCQGSMAPSVDDHHCVSHSLLEARRGGGCDGNTPPSAEVVGEHRFLCGVA